MALEDNLKIAQAFAEALDADDFSAAQPLLDEQCLYESPHGTLNGPETIIHSYRESSDWGKQHLDEVHYESSVEAVSETEFAILFTDHIRAGDAGHTYQCKQLVTLNGSGQIIRIVHRELKGRRSALEMFFRDCGLKR